MREGRPKDSDLYGCASTTIFVQWHGLAYCYYLRSEPLCRSTIDSKNGRQQPQELITFSDATAVWVSFSPQSRLAFNRTYISFTHSVPAGFRTFTSILHDESHLLGLLSYRCDLVVEIIEISSPDDVPATLPTSETPLEVQRRFSTSAKLWTWNRSQTISPRFVVVPEISLLDR